MYISNDIKYVGVNDCKIDMFEGQYRVDNGISYNSYVIIDEKIAVMDTVDAGFTHEWLDNLKASLGDRKPDYLIVQHMEPDHSSNISSFMQTYPDAVIVSNMKSFGMMKSFFGNDYSEKRIVVENGGELKLGKHILTFIMAPMVHWPEVMVTYDSADKVLFSADGFGKFGVIGEDEPWEDEARRYYIGIVGKYGMQVQKLLEQATQLDIKTICPLHGPVLNENLPYYIELYKKWSGYQPEKDGIVIAYTSVYGNTKKAVQVLEQKLKENGCPEIVVHDLTRCDMSKAIADAFKYSKLVLATTTYNADIFPFMHQFIHGLTERNFSNRTVAMIENGAWAPTAAKVMAGMLEKSKNITYTDTIVKITAALNDESMKQLDEMAKEICVGYYKADAYDATALFNIGYGLYVVTSNDGEKDNGLIVNTVTQVTDSPNRVAVTINKVNYSHHVILKSGRMNVNCLNTKAPFEVFERFGFKSGRTKNKFDGIKYNRSENGLAVLDDYINSFISLKVENYVDLGTHGMFICSLDSACVMNDDETMTYSYYHENVKPKPETKGKKGYVCKICSYVYEGEELPADFICPLCKHGVEDFEPIE